MGIEGIVFYLSIDLLVGFLLLLGLGLKSENLLFECGVFRS